MDNQTDSTFLNTLFYGDDHKEFRRETFHVERMINGYSVSLDTNTPLTATYCPDIPTVLAYIALAIGGEDAVPIMPVSPEEAGLIDDSQLGLPGIADAPSDISIINTLIAGFNQYCLYRHVEKSAEVFNKFGMTYAVFHRIAPYLNDEVVGEIRKELVAIDHGTAGGIPAQSNAEG